MNQSSNSGGDGSSQPGAGRHPTTATWDGRARLAVLGMGQLGGSVALGARAAGVVSSVVAFGRSIESLRRAHALGLCDQTTTSASEAVSTADVVLLSTPLRAIPAVVDAMRSGLRAGTLVIDVGSVKATAVRDIEARLPSTVNFVSCHPLAGTEHFGPEAARADLFSGRRCLICPSARTSGAALDRARELWQALGAEVLLIDDDLHDRVMAAVSHLPHVAAYALAGALGELPTEVLSVARGLSTTSLRDTSRVAASSPSMWRDIFLENRAALLPLIETLAARIDDFKHAIAAADGPRIEALLDDGRAARARILPE